MKFKPQYLILAALGALALGGCSEDNKVTGTTSTYTQVDRMAIPALNTALIPAGQK